MKGKNLMGNGDLAAELASMTPAEKVTQARVMTQASHPFFTYILMKMRWVEDERIKFTGFDPRTGTVQEQPTACVDSTGLVLYHPDLTKSLSSAELRGLVAHEALHPILGHFLEEFDNKQVGGVAQDLKINDILAEENITVPAFGYRVSNHQADVPTLGIVISDIHIKSSREIYNEMLQAAEKKGQQQSPKLCRFDLPCKKAEGSGGSQPGKGEGEGEGQSGNGKGEDGGGKPDKGDLSDADLSGKSHEEFWKEVVAQAAVLARQRGKLGSGLESLVDAILTAQIPWTEKLRRYIQADIVTDVSYRRPAKRSGSLGIYMPAVVRESLQMVIHLDTSGSMSGDPIQQCLDQIYQLLGSYDCIQADLICGDTALTDHRILSKRDRVDIRSLGLKGFGGTSHRFAVDWIIHNKPSTRVFISLTDGYSDIESVYGDLPPMCHKIIVLPEGSGSARGLHPYGEVIEINRVV